MGKTYFYKQHLRSNLMDYQIQALKSKSNPSSKRFKMSSQYPNFLISIKVRLCHIQASLLMNVSLKAVRIKQVTRLCSKNLRKSLKK